MINFVCFGGGVLFMFVFATLVDLSYRVRKLEQDKE